ncbi:MAG: phosphotransferase [Candidatus Bathyarchaeota archaeon]|nr:MAG: phosphotransferase [Candidatus Bathyarchaeota archaeon]
MDIELCKNIIEGSFPQIHVDSIKQTVGGWASDVFEVNNMLIFRFPKRSERQRATKMEINLLPELAKALSVQIPDFKFIGKHNKETFVGYRKILGVPLVSYNYNRGDLANQLAKIITEIHHFPVHLASKLEVPRPDWRMEYEKFYNWIKDKAFPLMNEALQERAVLVWEGFLENEDNFTFEPVFIHRDLSGDQHILCNPERHEITGIIDWEDSCIGDPAIDFTGLYWDCKEKFTKRVLANYEGKVDNTFWERTVFYYKIGAFHEISWGKLIDDDTHIQNGLKHLSKVL